VAVEDELHEAFKGLTADEIVCRLLIALNLAHGHGSRSEAIHSLPKILLLFGLKLLLLLKCLCLYL